MRVKLKGINSKTKRLADGSTRTYYWAWKGGPSLRGELGTPEFIASYIAAVAQKVAPPSGVLLALLFRFQESGEFQFGISQRTRRDYIKQIKRIERAFGDFPIKALDDPKAASSITVRESTKFGQIGTYPDFLKPLRPTCGWRCC